MKKLTNIFFSLLVVLTMTGIAGAFEVTGDVYTTSGDTVALFRDSGALTITAYKRDGGTYSKYDSIVGGAIGMSYNASYDSSDDLIYWAHTKDTEFPTKELILAYADKDNLSAVTTASITTSLSGGTPDTFHITKNRDFNGDPVVAWAQSGTIRLYTKDSGSWAAIDTGVSVQTKIMDIMALPTDNQVAILYDDSFASPYYKVQVWNIATSTGVSNETVTTDFASAGRGVIAIPAYNGKVVTVKQDGDYDLSAIYWDGAAYQTRMIDGSPTAVSKLDAHQWTLDTNKISVAELTTGGTLKEHELDVSTGTVSTNSVDTGILASTTPSVLGSKTAGETSDMMRMSYVKVGAKTTDPFLAIETSTGTYTTENMPITYNQQQGIEIPELPKNNLWKILVAVLALGLVVGIAAFRKKKGSDKV